MSRIAIVQPSPAFLDRAETTSITVSSVREAAEAGAQLVVFPEAFILLHLLESKNVGRTVSRANDCPRHGIPSA
jgi:predicted amidohydrolase